ncbi:DUF1942 domain-containing protein [Mycolicibacterium sp. P1-5]|uniref:DUF1942 domain-containing protein n=1 Tax=Mycolicibacterium sp. P1-5 TaxID=2024617 RepID=UPI0011F049D6|nr:DUF1942 domain-containing protein [Mycolicibacterium sp. P1-5]KAA0112301.1 DUF1942 domain-containing protein [Mycolicibacterium sp. P1-5]
MNIRNLARVGAAVAVSVGVGAVGVAAPAHAADNIKTFNQEATLNGPDSLPYIGYTVSALRPSSDAVPHRGDLYAAKLVINGYGVNANPAIERFGARSEAGDFYPAILGASNPGELYFDVVGPTPNSVVWNDGIRDILAWVPGQAPTGPTTGSGPNFPDSQSTDVAPAGPAPTEGDNNAIVATPNDIAPAPFQLTEGDVAQPGFNGGRR